MGDALRHQQPKKVLAKSFAWKRRLIEHCFIGRDRTGHPLGVYVMRSAEGCWTYKIIAILEKVLTVTPESDGEIEIALGSRSSKYAAS
jgi:hypothetical protein